MVVPEGSLPRRRETTFPSNFARGTKGGEIKWCNWALAHLLHTPDLHDLHLGLPKSLDHTSPDFWDELGRNKKEKEKERIKMTIRMAFAILFFGMVVITGIALVDHYFGPFNGAEKYAELYTSYKVYGVPLVK